ncbi:MAG: ferrochelatase, partial [Pseudomonadota bacterium]
MDRYQTEPAYAHGSTEKTAVLLVNLGTPEAPTAAALRRYLDEFLWDPRVVEIPRSLWWLILKGVILNLRPRKSAAKYASIWTPQGSPLKVHTERQAKLLRGALVEGKQNLAVAWAMRYGQPSIGATLDRLKAEGCTRILVVPLYPQYAASTTASVMDEVGAWLQRTRNLPELRYVRDHHDRPGYIAAL